MLQYYLKNDAVLAVARALNLSSDDTKKVEEAICSCWKDKIALVWSVGDVEQLAEERGQNLDEEQQLEVLQYVADHHDCELGVSYTTICCAIDEVVGAPNEIKDNRETSFDIESCQHVWYNKWDQLDAEYMYCCFCLEERKIE